MRAKLIAPALFLFLSSCSRGAGLPAELPTEAEGALQIVAFDVGQADALLINHRGHSMLIDAGASQYDRELAARRIPPRLDAIVGSRNIDYFVVSHYHKDHIGIPGGLRHNKTPAGIFALVEKKGVSFDTLLDRGTWTLGSVPKLQQHFDDSASQWLRTGAIRHRKTVRPGELIDMGKGLRVEVVVVSGNGTLERLRALYPTLLKNTPPSENDYSVGLKVTLGDFEFFTAGDLSGANVLRRAGPSTQLYTDVESHIAASVGPIEVYRVDHHGSRYSSNPCFTSVLRPQVSVFSTGKNTYGHPDADVYDRLNAVGDVYITGGADEQSVDYVRKSIVGGDVDIVVAPGGSHYWVNGKRYESMTDAAERAREGYVGTCDQRELREETAGGADDHAPH